MPTQGICRKRWFEGGFCSGANRQTAHKNPDNRANHDNLPASFACLRCEGALHVENLRESGERWRQKVQCQRLLAVLRRGGDPSCENEGRQPDRGANRLDPRGGGVGGARRQSGTRDDIYMCTCACVPRLESF